MLATKPLKLFSLTLVIFISLTQWSCDEKIQCMTIQFDIQEGNTFSEDTIALHAYFDYITAISESVSCSNIEEWKLTPIGSKACGGPSGFVAYHHSIDTTCFLTHVTNYTDLQETFNQKWGIGSDCAVETPPSISCQDNKITYSHQ